MSQYEDGFERGFAVAKETAVNLRAELTEAQSELARHHELIAWLREELEWALGMVESEFETPNRDLTEYVRARKDRERLDREVG